MHREPLQSLSEVTETTEEFRRVRVEGEMIKNSIRVGPKVRTSEVSNNEKIAGYDLITPMREKRNKNARRKGVWPFGGGGGSNDAHARRTSTREKSRDESRAQDDNTPSSPTGFRPVLELVFDVGVGGVLLFG